MERQTILLIDDSKSELRLFHEALDMLKYSGEVVSMADSEAAFHYIIKHATEIFMIVCDINMPRMTGPDILEKINADPNLKMQVIPFIFMSTSAADRDVRHAFNLAAQGYFQKPFGLEDMSRLFQTMIDYWSLSRKPSDVHVFQ